MDFDLKRLLSRLRVPPSLSEKEKKERKKIDSASTIASTTVPAYSLSYFLLFRRSRVANFWNGITDFMRKMSRKRYIDRYLSRRQ